MCIRYWTFRYHPSFYQRLLILRYLRSEEACSRGTALAFVCSALRRRLTMLCEMVRQPYFTPHFLFCQTLRILKPRRTEKQCPVAHGSHLIPLHPRTRMEDLFHSHPLFLATPRPPEAPRMLGQSFMLRTSYSKGRDNSRTLSASSLMEETQLTPSLTLYMSTPEHRNGEKG